MADRGRWLTGSVIVLIGVFFLLDTTDVLETSQVFLFVPSVVIALGLYMLIRHRFRHLFGPGVVLLFGIAWQLVALDYYSFGELFGTYWPVLIILFGLSLLVQRRRDATRRSHVQTSGDDSDVEILAIFGDGERRVSSDRFTHADLTVIFGDGRLDLRDATVHGTADVDAVVVFGDVEILVPESWDVRFDTTAVLGDVTDRRSSQPDKDVPDLVVSGVPVFGDITVRD
ncbi:LiaF transmembrane domain-containing protein [Halapricum salinum]|uniref:Cell wall-active antibiotics response LiaF-like C-terminal domain-containing protein n=1 Tax=Halapricum salinum TaxID=1457250 RepID=A0A4D6H8H3_9EURY|nr:DUF5668 domain-containing protein [Halapricum salinum]QCC50060.1 hypothetical protein DV733_01960 [Halapricum salinum]